MLNIVNKMENLEKHDFIPMIYANFILKNKNWLWISSFRIEEREISPIMNLPHLAHLSYLCEF